MARQMFFSISSSLYDKVSMSWLIFWTVILGGALLLALAGVILALSGGQLWAAVQTRAGVEETYTTCLLYTSSCV